MRLWARVCALTGAHACGEGQCVRACMRERVHVCRGICMYDYYIILLNMRAQCVRTCVRTCM